jgi:23S rRNA (pseudouridine1915-N3)-methyltransferase
LTILTVGRPGRLFAEAIAEYERRARRYWTLDLIEVREERAGRGRTDSMIRATESARLIERVPAGAELVALTRTGESWSSTRLARHLERLALEARPGAAFVIGGALGLGEECLALAHRQLALSPLTLPHELARLLLTEQLYRAGTIVRGEPYHKGS